MSITNPQQQIRRSARIHVLDIREARTIDLVKKFTKEQLTFYNFIIELSKEFIDAYLTESEADEKARLSGIVGYVSVPTWQPMKDGKPFGEPVSAKSLYARLGGTLCAEIRLRSEDT